MAGDVCVALVEAFGPFESDIQVRQTRLMTILETPRLILRELLAEDADALARVLSDPETMRYYPAPYDRAGVERWIARNRERYEEDGAGLWAMMLKPTPQEAGRMDRVPAVKDAASRGPSAGTRARASSPQNAQRRRALGTPMPAPQYELIVPHYEPIGDCGIVRQEIEGEYFYEIGYHLRREYWHQGLATEAARACGEWGFAHLRTERLISLIRPENAPSRHVAERNGMTIWKEINWHGLRHYVYSVQRQIHGAG
jgi:RimJ/RimL family protein N-acetyltransferase